MDKKKDLLKKYNLTEAVKRIQKINEYTFYDSTLVEDETDPNSTDDGGEQEMGGENPIEQGGEPQEMSMDNNQTNDPNLNDGMDNTDGMTADMGDANIGGEDLAQDIEMDDVQSDDEVVDVDDLTQSQEATEFKVDSVDDKLNKVLKVISTFTDAIEANDKKIEDLKKEFEKRNPTQEETLNLRSLASTPFSEKPEDYWEKQQELHPNYKVVKGNEDGSEKEENLEIRRSDIENFNEREVLKSLGENHIKLTDFLNF